MSAINELKIKNFKAFNEENVLKLGGKHLLLYGENGSGKSSIYWSLYTLLQCTTKSVDEIEKYFDRANNENLLNLTSTTDDSHIKISALDEVDTFHKIDRAGYTLEGTTARAFSYLEALNNSSDFIAHRLLINFYNFRNSKEINLWEVFVRDIFPFITVTHGGRTYTLSQLHKEIKETLPYWSFNLTRRTFKVRQKNHHLRIATNNKINALNQALNAELSVINGLVNSFYEDNFKEDYEENIEISLQYSTELVFGDIVQKEKRGVVDYLFPSKRHIKLNTPFINLNIRNQKEDGNWQDILRPQSYFNEAKLTQIALSVRFALTEQRMGTFEGQFLALDDLLVSLDMSNRDKVLDIILDKFAHNYKIYLFTHEKTFFNMAKARIESEHNPKNWLFKEMYGIDETNKEPIIRDYKNYLTRSIDLYKQKDYPASVNYLRKELEKVLDINLPSKIKKGESGEPIATLDGLITSGIVFLEKLNVDARPLKKCKQYVQILMNPLSHNEEDIDAYETDIKRIRKIIEELDPYLSDLKKRTKEVFPRLKEINLIINENDGETSQKYKLSLKEDLYVITATDGSKNLSNCKVHSVESRTYINGILEEKDSYKNEHWKHNNLSALYSAVCERKEIEVQTEYFDFYQHLDGRLLSEFL
ncbi:hypothetical protein FEZ18_06680 [Oceanihabitans sp. IOP_32]|uniref:AAA family ATPase n=1 Tax=Oceanihabitans sp. IOP_32 TaxID=2529032 RepID=UPI00129323E2|nr:AAA family ATPase [Oceanihabitans sp. IOP_32]QFZ54501.1 hypothetical protein FEZ18_06680 [Oceanihabitans sp. IOP_32]